MQIPQQQQPGMGYAAQAPGAPYIPGSRGMINSRGQNQYEQVSQSLQQLPSQAQNPYQNVKQEPPIQNRPSSFRGQNAAANLPINA